VQFSETVLEAGSNTLIGTNQHLYQAETINELRGSSYK